MATLRPCTRRPARARRGTTLSNFNTDEFLVDLWARTHVTPKPVFKRRLYPRHPLKWTSDATDIHPAILDMYAKYNNHGHRAPVDILVKVFTEAGYPPHMIEYIVNMDIEQAESALTDDKFLHDIFGSVSVKKEAAPKKKTLRQLLHMKKVRAPKIEEDVEVA